ncbi:MAG: hypothetical protein IIA88_05980 [Bacteroidetes bacterium]|nr:hypothetical protein [Bacteroidota bacterium]
MTIIKLHLNIIFMIKKTIPKIKTTIAILLIPCIILIYMLDGYLPVLSF